MRCCILEVLLSREDLAHPEELQHFVDRWLNVHEHDVTGGNSDGAQDFRISIDEYTQTPEEAVCIAGIEVPVQRDDDTMFESFDGRKAHRGSICDSFPQMVACCCVLT